MPYNLFPTKFDSIVVKILEINKMKDIICTVKASQSKDTESDRKFESTYIHKTTQAIKTYCAHIHCNFSLCPDVLLRGL